MNDLRTNGIEDFPRFGARARILGRFERDLRDWLATPEGRFAVWRAAGAVPPAPPAGDPAREASR